jgi:hypothetical protein
MKTRWLTILGIVALTFAVTRPAQTADTNGAGSSIPAYYDGALLTIHFVEFSAQAEQSHLAHDKNLNFIYQSDPGLPGGEPFISVIDAVQGDGFNPLWEEVQITFTKGNTPHQFFSDNDVLAAAISGEITLEYTGEVYWCPIVGPKK